MMRQLEVQAHAYVSAWAPLDAAIARFSAASRSNDEPFHNLVMTLVDAAVNGAALYSPGHTDAFAGVSPQPLYLEMNGVRVWALYTDEKRAEACARICAVYPLWITQRIPLEQALAQEPAALALNMGLPDQLILPPDVVRTVARLAMLRKTGAKMAPGSAWEDWAGIMERWYERKAREEKKPLPAALRQLLKPRPAAEQELQAAQTVMAIPVRDAATPPQGSRPQQAPRILLG